MMVADSSTPINPPGIYPINYGGARAVVSHRRTISTKDTIFPCLAG